MTPDEFDAITPGARVCWAGVGNEQLPGTVVAVLGDPGDDWNRTIRVRWDDDKPGLEHAEYCRADAANLLLWPVPEAPPPEPSAAQTGPVEPMPIPTPTKRSTRVQTRPRQRRKAQADGTSNVR